MKASCTKMLFNIYNQISIMKIQSMDFGLCERAEIIKITFSILFLSDHSPHLHSPTHNQLGHNKQLLNQLKMKGKI